jgi:hypothetical protein
VKWCSLVVCAALVLAGCGSSPPDEEEAGPSVTMTIRWQRLVTEDGGTCSRCSGTGEEFRAALASLRQALRPLGIEVASAEVALSPDECAADIMQSNRIWIEDRPLEEWLGAEVGASLCEACCPGLDDDVQCRTVSVDGKTYEVVPAQLIVRAGLIAASDLLGGTSPGACCPAAAGGEEGDAPCCPESGTSEEGDPDAI